MCESGYMCMCHVCYLCVSMSLSISTCVSLWVYAADQTQPGVVVVGNQDSLVKQESTDSEIDKQTPGTEVV